LQRTISHGAAGLGKKVRDMIKLGLC